MSKNCILTVNDSEVFKALKKRFGTNETEAFAKWVAVVENGEFTPAFQEWQKAKRKTEEVVTLDTANTRTIVNDIIAYYNTLYPDGNTTILHKKNNKSVKYNSTADRSFCQKIVAVEILDIFRNEHYTKNNAKSFTKQDYINEVRSRFFKRLLNRFNITNTDIKPYVSKNINRFTNLVKFYIEQGIDKQSAMNLAMSVEAVNFVREKLGKNINIQDTNFLAVIEEMHDFNINENGVKIADAFFEEIFYNKKLEEIRRENKDEFNTAEEDKAQENENVNLGESTTESDDITNDEFDMSFRVFDSHDGQYATFTTHIGGNIRSYLNCLRKLKGTGLVNGQRYYDTDNAIGIAEAMDATTCAKVLYTQADFTNVSSMITSIRRIAETVSGFEGFIQFAEDLENNYDFAYEVYTTFGKMVISKTETYIENGERKVRISNTTADPVSALRFEYINQFRTSVTNDIHDFVANEVNQLTTELKKIKDAVAKGKIYDAKTKKLKNYNKETNYKEDKAKLVASLVKSFKRYLPSIEQSAILSYINNTKTNGIVDELDNINVLINHLNNLVQGAKSSYAVYASRLIEASSINRENNLLRQRQIEGEFISASKFKDPNSVWSESYITNNATSAVIQLANILVPYSVIKTELNSRNAKGNLSSDVINSNMITNFMAMLEHRLNYTNEENTPLKNYGAYKFRSKQYDLSNILVEKEKNGVIINYGLFKLENGKYIPTNYATELIKMTLFNGISDFGNGKSAVYSEMSKGDYVTTAMINFWKSNHISNNSNIEFADYFMRIPSDAPKNFVMSAPKYSLTYKNGGKTINFWKIDNESQMNSRIRELINNIPHNTDYEESLLDSQNISIKQSTRILTGRTLDNINISNKKALYKESNSLIGYLNVTVDGVNFIIKGTLNDNKTALTNVTLHGVIDNFGNAVAYGSELYAGLTDYYKRQLISGKIKLSDGSTVKRSINKEHPIFQQFYAVFKQEMQNAATAIDRLFDHNQGIIKRDEKGNVIYSEQLSQLDNPDRATYANYHHKNSVYYDKNGVKHEEKGIIQNVWKPIYDENGKIKYHEKTNWKRLSGNVFTSDRFTLFDKENNVKRNFLNDILSEERAEIEDGMIHILYGGANTHLHINSNGEIEFTEAQQKLIESKIEEFIKAYIEDTIERVNPYKVFLEGVPHNENDIAEFILNYRLAYINCNDLFEGDTKFYKSAQDFLKRAKEVQGSGVPYGIVDFTKPMFGQVHQPVEHSYLNSAEMQAIVGKLNNCKQFTTFRGATVINTVRTSKESQEILVKQLTDNFKKEDITEEEAERKAKAIMKGYTNTKVNDAQSYITFEEWIRRISARGQLHKYKPLIEAILDETKPLNVEDINEFIQVQKNFYYDQVYDTRTGVMAPRQIKNAEFVLVPRLIKGTELETIYNTMIRHGIDQLNTEETSKAGKTNVLTLWDKDGNLKKEWLDDFNINIQGAIETYDYNYLYTQQETPQHINSENKAGVQIMKKILDNIDKNNELYSAKQKIIENYSYNIYESSQKLMEELNISFDDNGNIKTDEYGKINGLNYDVFLSKLKDEMARLGLDSNMFDFVTRIDSSIETASGQNGIGLQTKMPPFLNSNRKKLESISNAIFNNTITRQKLPGFHAAQVTQIGFKPLNETVEKHSYSRELKYHPNGERHIEVMLPASAFGLDRNSSMFNELRDLYRHQGLTIDEIESKIDDAMLDYIKTKGLDTFIGYRIPTESKASICVMKVVGFVSEAYGSTIIVPDDWVAQTGSDFDIDSIYGITYSINKLKNGGIEKTPYTGDLAKDGKKGRNNAILDAMIEILQHDNSLEENLSQSQFKDIIDAREEIVPKNVALARDSRSTYDFLDQADYFEDAISGAKLKAFSVTLDNQCSLCNTVKPVFSKPISIIYEGDNAKFEELQKRFNINDKENVIKLSNNKILVRHTTLGYSTDNKNVEGKIITGYSAQTTAHHLDAIKEGSIPNVNDTTFAVYKLFPNIGSNYETAIAFMMQPGITAIVNNNNKNKSIYAKGYKNPINEAILDIAKALKLADNNTTYKKAEALLEKELIKYGLNDYNVLNSEILKQRLNVNETENSLSVKDLLFDYLVIKQYKELSNIATKLGNIARVTNPDKFGAKQTIFATNKVFEDIKEILLDSSPVFALYDGKSFLDRIYPGIETIIYDSIDNYLNNSDNNSAYPSLHYFLKYASAASIKINRNLFVTQRPLFRTKVNLIKKVISGANPRISEDTYNLFESYILNSLYKEVKIISEPVTYIKGKGITSVEGDSQTEINRIFGYGYKADLQVTDDSGNESFFEPKDINNLTQEEIDLFTKFTPAQKVYWIKQHFRDGLICNYIKSNTFNSNTYRKSIAGAQTIEFAEDNIDIESVYDLFKNTYMNTNPLLALTAMDIIKYAFIVEGYRMKKGAVNKIIDNDILINPKGLEGTGIVDALNDIVNMYANDPSIESTEKLTENFVRSHSNISEIANTWINKENRAKYFKNINNGIETVFINDDTEQFLNSNNLGYTIETEEFDDEGVSLGITKEFIANPYIKITYNSKSNTLYKIIRSKVSNVLYLLPLNLLQENETGMWSANNDNNKYMPIEWYEDIVSTYEQSHETWEVKSLLGHINADTKTVKDYNKPERRTISKNTETTPFNRVKEKDSIDTLHDIISTHFNGTTSDMLILKNRLLENHIKNKGIENGLLETVNGNVYCIYKLNTSKLYKYTTEKGLNKTIEEKDKIFEEQIEKARNLGIATGHKGQAHVNNLFAVVPYVHRTTPLSEEELASSVTEDIIKIDKAIKKEAYYEGTKESEKYVTQQRNKSVKDNLNDVVISTSEYLKVKVDNILNGEHGLNMFARDPETGSYLSITDSKVVDLIKADPSLRRKYLKTILMANHLIDKFSSFNTFKYTEDNAHLKYYVEEINKTIKKLSESNILKEAEELYVTGYLASISNNPVIKDNIISLLDGFHSTSYLTSYIHDLQETANPIIQIITSDVMSDIRAKEFQGEQRVKEFKKFIATTIAEAKSKGLSVNWDNLVDKYGKWITEYNDKFSEDLENLKNAKDNAYAEYKTIEDDYDKSVAFEKYLKAKLAYDEFLLKHTNREIEDEYYKQMLDIEKSMINTDTGKFADIYVEYKMLNDQLRDVLSHKGTGALDPHFEQKKNEILNAIKNLRSDVYKDATGNWVSKRDLEEYEFSNDAKIKRNQNLNTLSSANRLTTFINKRNELNDKYYERTERFGFREQLQKYLDVIQKYERRNLTEDDLAEIPEYVTAKTWVKENAFYQYDLYKATGTTLTKRDAEKYLEEYFDGLFDPNVDDFQIRVKAALEYFKNTRGERHNKKAVYKRIALKEDARDELGIIDARKFDEDEIAAIKAEQEIKFNIGESVAYSERNIIHSSSSDNTIYTSTFYEGMKIHGLTNPEYLKIINGYSYEENGSIHFVDGINTILRRCINPSTGVLETSKLNIDEIEYVLGLLEKLGYDRHEQTFTTQNGVRKYKGVRRKNVKKVNEFIKKNVEFVLTEEDKRKFDAEKAKARTISDSYYLSWCELNQEWSEERQEFIPNHLFWGHAQPKTSLPKEERDKFISKQKTAAINILKEVFTEVPTKYYELERTRIANTYGTNSPEYEKWMLDNHVYNPNTHRLEPLTCWTKSEPNSNMPGTWEPTYQISDKSVKEEFRNPNYKKGLGIKANYKTNSNSLYNRNVELNEYEKKVKDYVQNLLAALATTKKAKQYIEKGYLPSKAVKEDKKFSQIWLKELAKGFGYVEGNSDYERWDNDISYDNDYVPDMPMLSQLITKDTHRKPYREMYKTDEEYKKALENYETNKEQYEKENAKIHSDILDRNWEEVISEFIIKAAHYNAVQDNKLRLYFGQKLLNDILIYQNRNYTSSQLAKDRTLSNEETAIYKKKKDENLQKQYANWCRRVIFDQFKENQGRKTRLMTILQGITSTNYMTLNIRGGIANVLIGESNIFGEVFAKEYFGAKDWAIGKQIWISNIASFMANMYNDTSTSLGDAIVKAMSILDYDEITGRVSQAGLEEWSKRLRDIAFSPQTVTEHFMQNAAMFSMMNSHRVVTNPDYGKPGQPEYILMNKEEYMSESMKLALYEIMSEEEKQQFESYIKDIKEDPNNAKDYARFHKNAISTFVITKLSKEKQNLYSETVKKYRKEKAKDFENHPTLYSQFKLGSDGKLDFADNSILANINVLKDNQEVSDAYKLLGKFKGRVISVNKKIHGNYGKLDAASIESQWWGSIVMQYHKHIYPGIMKRYRRHGYFNEERGTIEKGSYVALYDFLTTPIKQIAERNNLSEGQTETLVGIQNLFGMITDYFHYVKLNYNTMPEYEKANMRRVLGDVAGMLTAVMMSMLLRLGFDDDDESIVYNLGLYEADRLATEAFMWNPVGLYAEAKKLWSSPIAAQSIIGDGLNIMGTISGMIFEGEDYNPYFTSGRYAGEHKLGVYVERRIPYWRNYVALRDIAESNHYYKMGDNILTVLPVKEWAKSIKD